VKSRTDHLMLNGKAIDALMMKTDTGCTIHYRVHVGGKNGRWYSWITGYNKNNAISGYAGSFGKAIDAIEVYLDKCPSKTPTTPTTPTTPSCTTVYVTADTLNVRSGPSTNYGVIGSMSNGSSTCVYNYVKNSESFFQRKEGGYVSGKWLSTTKPSSGGNSGGNSGGSCSNGNAANITTKFNTSVLSKSKFISTLNTLCPKKGIPSELCNGENVWNYSQKAGVNPALVIVRAINEGFAPGKKDGSHNYWGIAVYNGQTSGARYSNLQDAIAGFAKIVVNKGTIGEMMKSYAYIGDYWYNPGSWGDGGCKYFPYIRKYMSSSRASTVERVCNGAQCSISGNKSSCTRTTSEDQAAYTAYNVNSAMGPLFKEFGIC